MDEPTGGDGHYSYQWYKGVAEIPGATAATYQPETYSSNTVVVYTRGAKDASCSASTYAKSSNNYTLTVNNATTATTNLVPAAQAVCNNVSFTVTAGIPAGALGYTWKRSNNGAEWEVVTGQTTNVLNADAITDAGTYYYKVTVMTDANCSVLVESTPATVTVNAAPDAGNS